MSSVSLRPVHSWRIYSTSPTRLLLVLLARMVRTWKETLFLVQPETLLRWHHELFCVV